MFVSTNVRFLENDYMMTNKPSSEVDWRALDVTFDSSLAAAVAMEPFDSRFDPRQRRHLIRP